MLIDRKLQQSFSAAIAGVFSIFALAIPSHAAEKNCQFKRSGSDFFNGVTYDAEFYVVAAKYRSSETNKCRIRFVPSRNGGTQPNQPIVISKKPKLNSVKLRDNNDIAYDADKIGEDYFEFERHWRDKKGVLGSATVRVKVFVVKGPL